MPASGDPRPSPPRLLATCPMDRASHLRTWSRTGALVVVTGLVALAGCSSSSGSSAKDGTSSSSSRTGSATNTNCATKSQATAALGSKGQATAAPYCAGGYAAGSASNGQIDFSYILVQQNGTWVTVSDAVRQEICTSNPNKLPKQLVDDGCNS